MSGFTESRERFAVELAYDHDLALPQARMLAELALHALDPTFAPESPRHLADPAVAEAYVSSPLGHHGTDESADRLDELAWNAIEGGADTAGAWYARALVAEWRGDVESQRSHLTASLVRDGSFGPSLAALGFLAFVEGDAGRAGRLLVESGDPEVEGLLHTLSHYPPRSSKAGRNDPCPCGSGVKRKLCCPGGPPHPLEDRSVWLWEKAATWLHRVPQHHLLLDVAARLAGSDDFTEDGPITVALHHPLMESIALLDGGLLEVFLDRLGGLLPEDERDLAQRWTGARHDVWEVISTDPGRTLLLTDASGDVTVEAVNGSVSRCTSPGEIIYASVVPTGSGWFLPCHPECLTWEEEEDVLELIEDGRDPLAVSARVLRRGHGARR